MTLGDVFDASQDSAEGGPGKVGTSNFVSTPKGFAPQPQVLIAQTNDVRSLARLLRGIGFRHNAIVTLSEAGLQVSVEEVRTLSAFIPTKLFQTYEYTFPGEAPTFEISLDALLQCLNIFGNAGAGGSTAGVIKGNKRRWAGEGDGEDDDADDSMRRGKGDKRTGMRMTWLGQGEQLSLLLSDDAKGPFTRCDIKTMQPEEMMDQDFDHDNRVLYLIMKSEWLRDALLDLPPSSDRITLSATPPYTARPGHVPHATSSSDARRTHKADIGSFSISAEGDFGVTQLDYPNEKEVIERFDCAEMIRFSYHWQHFTYLSRALQQSVKLALMIEASGFLSVQIMMPVTQVTNLGEHNGIIDFKMHALEEDE